MVATTPCSMVTAYGSAATVNCGVSVRLTSVANILILCETFMCWLQCISKSMDYFPRPVSGAKLRDGAGPSSELLYCHGHSSRSSPVLIGGVQSICRCRGGLDHHASSAHRPFLRIDDDVNAVYGIPTQCHRSSGRDSRRVGGETADRRRWSGG